MLIRYPPQSNGQIKKTTVKNTKAIQKDKVHEAP